MEHSQKIIKTNFLSFLSLRCTPIEGYERWCIGSFNFVLWNLPSGHDHWPGRPLGSAPLTSKNREAILRQELWTFLPHNSNFYSTHWIWNGESKLKKNLPTHSKMPECINCSAENIAFGFSLVGVSIGFTFYCSVCCRRFVCLSP